MEAKRKLKKVFVNFISLVNKGANRKTILFKSGESINKEVLIKKIDENEQIIYGIVYSPDEVDTQGDTASIEVIKDMAYLFMKNAYTNNVDLLHNSAPHYGYVAESWIVKESDQFFNNEKPGSWAVAIKIEDSKVWDKIKSGEITGLSMAGFAEAVDVQKKEESDLVNSIASLNEKLDSFNKKSEGFAELFKQLKPQSDDLSNFNERFHLNKNLNQNNIPIWL